MIHELKIAVVPTPNAMHPTAPACGVCESEPMMIWPGSACASRIFEWQIASDPCADSAPCRFSRLQLAVQLHPLLGREDPLLRLELIRDIEQPHLDVLRAHHLRRGR